MATFAAQFSRHAAVYGGIIGGLSLTAFEIVASAYAGPPDTATTPLRMVGATVLGSHALAPSYPLPPVAAVGLAIVMAFAVAFSSLFVAIVTRIRNVTGDEFLNSPPQRACAGLLFGVVAWLSIFYGVAPLVGWSWFAADVHTEIAVAGYALFFGLPIGWFSVHRDANHSPRSRQRETRGGHLSGVTVNSQFDPLAIQRALPRLVALLAAVMVVAFCIWLVAIYVGVEYVRPPWDSNSVPPERLY